MRAFYICIIFYLFPAISLAIGSDKLASSLLITDSGYIDFNLSTFSKIPESGPDTPPNIYDINVNIGGQEYIIEFLSDKPQARQTNLWKADTLVRKANTKLVSIDLSGGTDSLEAICTPAICNESEGPIEIDFGAVFLPYFSIKITLEGRGNGSICTNGECSSPSLPECEFNMYSLTTKTCLAFQDDTRRMRSENKTNLLLHSTVGADTELISAICDKELTVEEKNLSSTLYCSVKFDWDTNFYPKASALTLQNIETDATFLGGVETTQGVIENDVYINRSIFDPSPNNIKLHGSIIVDSEHKNQKADIIVIFIKSTPSSLDAYIKNADSSPNNLSTWGVWDKKTAVIDLKPAKTVEKLSERELVEIYNGYDTDFLDNFQNTTIDAYIAYRLYDEQKTFVFPQIPIRFNIVYE